MIEENENDLLMYLDIDDFAEYIIINGVRIRAIYDRQHLELFEGNTVISSTQPRVLCRTRDVASVDIGTQVSVRGSIHEVADIQPDGTGFTMLMLHIR